jgi:hypothetical protein
VNDDEALESARRLAVTLLAQHEAPTKQQLDDALIAATAGVGALGGTVDGDRLRRIVESEISVWVDDSTVLTDPDENHRPWLDRRRGEIDWAFWRAYHDWVGTRLPVDVVRKLDRFTDQIIDQLEDPSRDGPWDRRGMVVGQVQSGKTSNYTGLICKAADAGYPFIVVLAGLHNSLRSQTQARLDEGFLGLDSRTTEAFSNTNRAIGVRAGGRNHPPAMTLTSSDDKGDFSKQVAGRVAMRIGRDPVLLVVKKHKTILTNLIDWITTSNGDRDPYTGRRVVTRFPLLVIDDEADNASVNTKEIEWELDDADESVISETNPSEINRLIRLLLHSFQRSSLVSYTATPFANIFIDEDRPSPQWGEDLFPRSFILRMPPPSNYVGPAEVFGLSSSDDPAGVERRALPVLRAVDDADDWLTPGHRKTEIPGPLPDTLREALLAFLLVCAARAARGQVNVHNSMLVHVTRFVDVQAHVYSQIQDELDRIQDALKYGGGTHKLRSALRSLWEQDFQRTSQRMPDDMREQSVIWADVERGLDAAASRIHVLQINGTAGDTLTYADHPDGVSVIAIGGDKLSRGLTLEGLSVSYYLRASKMYDTLMQMGRWFGYRRGYNDLVRLYTTRDLQMWYRDITAANEELNAKFDQMAAVKSNPREFALYVRKSPAGLLVTAQAKMRSGRNLKVSFSGDIVETISFRRRLEVQAHNAEATARFLETQSTSGRRESGAVGENRVWRDVPGDAVAALLDTLHTSEQATKANGRLLATYVRSRVRARELTDWVVAVVDNSQASDDKRVGFGGEEQVGLTFRKADDVADADTYAIGRLASPGDERIDLDGDEYDRALASTLAAYRAGLTRAKKEPRDPLGPYVRRVRPKERGLLVLYLLDPVATELEIEHPIVSFAVSFPESPGAPTVDYVVPRRYWEQQVA